MTYLDLINNCWRLHGSQDFGSNEIARSFCHMNVCDRQGWPTPLVYPNSKIGSDIVILLETRCTLDSNSGKQSSKTHAHYLKICGSDGGSNGGSDGGSDGGIYKTIRQEEKKTKENITTTGAREANCRGFEREQPNNGTPGGVITQNKVIVQPKWKHLLMKAKVFALAAIAAAAIFSSEEADACSRVLYVGDSTSATASQPLLRIVGRSLDWKTPIPTNLYVYPRGMKKVSDKGDNVISWTSKYGAIYAVSYDGGVTEGMNEKGLVVNGLFCKNTVYGSHGPADAPDMSLAVFVAWMLDNNATTAEVVEALRSTPFKIGGATFDGGTVSALHWGITDAGGNCAVIEFDHGAINIFEGKDMPVLTNDPAFPSMEAINGYWQGVGGENMLPGTVKSPDRFVRGYFFQGHVERTNDADLGLTIIRSILANVSVPYKYAIETEPNVSSTQWRSFANLRDGRYYFDVVTNPGIFYVDLGECDLRPGAPVMRLDTSKSSAYVGDATSRLEKHAPFTPMY